MFRLTKQADYATVLLTFFAVACRAGEGAVVYSARDLSQRALIPLPTVSKILKRLVHEGILGSQRGVQGGYRLARAAQEITVAQIVIAIEGPIAVTQCCQDGESCAHELTCPVRPNWQHIGTAIYKALSGVTLWDMSAAPPLESVQHAREADHYG